MTSDRRTTFKLATANLRRRGTGEITRRRARGFKQQTRICEGYGTDITKYNIARHRRNCLGKIDHSNKQSRPPEISCYRLQTHVDEALVGNFFDDDFLLSIKIFSKWYLYVQLGLRARTFCKTRSTVCIIHIIYLYLLLIE